MDSRKYETVDDDTGEIIEAPAPPFEPEPEPEAEVRERYETAPEPESRGQEIIPPGHEYAADGAIMMTQARTAGNFVDMLEDGRLSRDIAAHLRGLQQQMAHVHDATGRKAKGKLVVTIDLEKEGEHFDARAKFTVKAPEVPRPKTVMWSDPTTGNFTRFPPGQAQMFGTRPVRNVP